MSQKEAEIENLDYEPEWCEYCSMECKQAGHKYEFNWFVVDGIAYCEHCDRPL